MELHKAPTAETGMLIRRPAAEVFEAIVDPAVTTKFWFTHSSGRLDGGKAVEWEWRMYGVSTTVEVNEIVRNEKIVMQWNDPPTTVAWTFTEMPGDTTFLEVRNFGFAGSGDEQVSQGDRLSRRLLAGAGRRQGVARTGPDAWPDRRSPPHGHFGRIAARAQPRPTARFLISASSAAAPTC